MAEHLKLFDDDGLDLTDVVRRLGVDGLDHTAAASTWNQVIEFSGFSNKKLLSTKKARDSYNIKRVLTLI